MERSVILYSADPSFLERRGNVLDRRSTSIYPVCDSEGLRETLDRLTPDLIVLNDTGSTRPLFEALGIVRTRTGGRTTALVLVVRPENADEIPPWVATRERTEILRAPVEPGDLLQASAQLAGWPVRRHVRVLVQVRVELAGGTKTFLGFTRDLSVGGMALQLAGQQLPAGMRVTAHFRLPNLTEDVQVPAEILRVSRNADGYVHGMCFTDAAPPEIERIRTFVGGQ